MKPENKKVIQQLRELLNVGDKDIPRTLLRFKKEIGDMEKELES